MSTLTATRITATVAGRVYEVTTNGADMLAYEQAAYQQHLPPMDKGGAVTFAAYMSWAAARRTEQTELKWSQWREQLEDIDMPDAEPVDPTPPAVTAG